MENEAKLMLTKILRIVVFLVLLGVVTTVFAQNDCPEIVKRAFEAVQTACANTARNQACYGNVLLAATPREGVSNFTFEKAGDIVDVANIQSLQLSGMDVQQGNWGVVMMKLQANMPDVLPGQNATFLLFGDVNISNAAEPLVELEATTTAQVDVHQRPETDGDVLIGSLPADQTITANGRLEDGSWIRVRLVGDLQWQTGWLPTAALTVGGDLNSLNVVTADSQAYGPMQAFYLKTGFHDPPCAEVPESGILVQGPEGFHVNLNVNGADISMGSTLFFQTNDEKLKINVLQGQAVVTTDEGSEIVPEGSYTSFPVDDEGEVVGAPEQAQPYDVQELQDFPLDENIFPENVEVAPPADEADLLDLENLEDPSRGDENLPGESSLVSPLDNIVIDEATPIEEYVPTEESSPQSAAPSDEQPPENVAPPDESPPDNSAPPEQPPPDEEQPTPDGG